MWPEATDIRRVNVFPFRTVLTRVLFTLYFGSLFCSFSDSVLGNLWRRIYGLYRFRFYVMEFLWRTTSLAMVLLPEIGDLFDVQCETCSFLACSLTERVAFLDISLYPLAVLVWCFWCYVIDFFQRKHNRISEFLLQLGLNMN